MAEFEVVASNSRVIRVFLSSTFRDFMEERDLLVKQVFPELRRKARERGVEVVDVDLRWGITEKESRQGKVIPICLGEIDRCRPYFVGMLGERYGWIPPASQYSPQVIERQPWLTQHLGGVSVTELEILHGVLNDPAMAGRAFFYFRDPAWSTSQSEPGFVCSGPAEAAKLADLKKRIRASGFPVAEKLSDPKALADQIGSDLWDLIEQQYPDLDEADALEREERQHASYRRSRLGVYLGGKRSINQLERWIDAGQQKILITGESGAGKSALIANWIEVHRQNHPEDVVFAHHLGCSNDASAIRPLLARLIDTAKHQLPEVYGYSLSVPQDWWELVAKAVEALQSLGRWAQQNNHRWIWVLDGLDRLDPDDQQALPWLPLTIPEGVVIMASALECPAREILLERKCKTRTIAPLTAKEQDALIKQYLGRYTKQLIAELRQSILSHPLAGSPLFLRVLLEELRQCGRYETLDQQLSFYLSAQAVDDLYERVLERLEDDAGTDAVQAVMSALWASRSGLSEVELLAITGLAPLQWAPIELALEEAFSRNGERLTFGHDYLRIAARDRYLREAEQQRLAHSALADWFQEREGWDERDSEELPWQLLQADRISELKDLIVTAKNLAQLEQHRGSREAVNYWLQARAEDTSELDEVISASLENEIARCSRDAEGQLSFLDSIAHVLDEAGLYRSPLLRLRELSIELEERKVNLDRRLILDSLTWLARTHQLMGSVDKAKALYLRCLNEREQLLGGDHPDTLISVNNLGLLYLENGEYEKAEVMLERGLESSEHLLGPEHPDTLISVNNLGLLHANKGDYEQAEKFYTRCLEAEKRLLGVEHQSTLKCMNNLGQLYADKGNLEQAEALFEFCLEGLERLLGPEHPDTLTAAGNQGVLFHDNGKYQKAEAMYMRCLEVRERLMGPEHPDTLVSINNLGALYRDKGDYEKAKTFYKRSIEGLERLLGSDHPDTIISVSNLGDLLRDEGEYDQAEAYYTRCLEARERLLGPEHPDTNGTRFGLANLLSDRERYDESIPLRRLELEVAAKRDGRNAPRTLTSIQRLADDLYWHDELKESEQLHREALAGRIKTLGDDDNSTMASRFCLANCLSAQNCYSEAIELRRLELTWCRQQDGATDPGTLTSINALAMDLRETGALEEAEALFRELLAGRQQVLEPSDFDIGRALGGLAKTLRMAGKLEEALDYSQQALNHRLAYEGPDAWWTNRERIDLARVLHKLGNNSEALDQLNGFKVSMARIDEPDDDDRKLISEAEELLRAVQVGTPE